MSRLVKKTANGPQEVKCDCGDEKCKSNFICMCGLSKNQPFCDGSHKRTLDEDKNKTYVYDDEKRVKLDK